MNLESTLTWPLSCPNNGVHLCLEGSSEVLERWLGAPYVNQLDEFEKKVALDLFYLKYRSLGMDLLIVWRTIKTVAFFRGL